MYVQMIQPVGYFCTLLYKFVRGEFMQDLDDDITYTFQDDNAVINWKEEIL